MSGEDRFRELAPLFALGALDGDDLAAFNAHLPTCAECRAEVDAYAAVAGRIGAGVPPVPPSPALRQRVLAAAAAEPVRPAPDRAPAVPPSARAALPPRKVAWWPAGLAAAAALVLGLALLVTRAQLRRAHDQAQALAAQVEDAERQVTQLRRQLTQAQAVRELVSRPGSRLTLLAGLQPAPQASARVVWDAATRDALLLASGLQPPPAGQAYELWVIGPSNQPVPAGVFQPSPDGTALVRLPQLWETAQARTFAVTLEPAAGSPSPTGPMVLAGAVS